MQKLGPHQPPGATRYHKDPTVTFKVGYLSKQSVLINNASVDLDIVVPTGNQTIGNYLYHTVDYITISLVSGQAIGHYVAQADVVHTRRLKHQTIPELKGVPHTPTTVVSDHTFAHR